MNSYSPNQDQLQPIKSELPFRLVLRGFFPVVPDMFNVSTRAGPYF